MSARRRDSAFLSASLEATGGAYIALDEGVVAYVTASAGELLGCEPAGAECELVGRPWKTVWADLCPDGTTLTAEPKRVLLQARAQAVVLLAWQRPVAGSNAEIVGLEETSSEDAEEREVLRIFSDMQEQADNLFALYQITQFLNNANELDQLCSTLLRELERLTLADVSCLYLATPSEGLLPKVWHGLASSPTAQADSESAREWFERAVEGRVAHLGVSENAGGGTVLQVLSLPLVAEDRLVGLALLAYQGGLQREANFLQTVAKEMGTALLGMQGRQALLAQEQKLEAIVTSTTDAIIQVGHDSRIRDFNPAAERLTGYATAEALTRTCTEIFGCGNHGGCGGGASCPFLQVLAGCEPIPYAEIEMASPGIRDQGLGISADRQTPAPDPRPRHIAASVAALDLGQETAAAVGILRDVSKQKQIEQMKSVFLAMVSHQLRTPLALLRGYVDTMLHLDLTVEERDGCITGIADTTERLERLVTQILDVTRIEEGRMDLEREPVRLVDVVRVAIMSLPYATYRSRIWAEIPADLPPVLADRQRLEQVVINLLDNALKYSPPAGQVVIRAARSGEYIEVEVLDEGIGIRPEDRESVFDKFQRGGNARDLQLPGTGLGLFICRSIVQAHGGDMSLSDGPLGGTRVAFRMPLGSTEYRVPSTESA